MGWRRAWGNRSCRNHLRWTQKTERRKGQKGCRRDWRSHNSGQAKRLQNLPARRKLYQVSISKDHDHLRLWCKDWDDISNLQKLALACFLYSWYGRSSAYRQSLAQFGDHFEWLDLHLIRPSIPLQLCWPSSEWGGLASPWRGRV